MPRPQPWTTERLLNALDGSDNPSKCWNWTKYRNPQGYGNLGIAGKHWKAHRLAYTLFVGPIPDGMDVLHRCDNPPCCNPAHLFLGNDHTNMRDKMKKGRHVVRRGEECGRSKLTESQVLMIRRLRDEGQSLWQIAHQYSTSAAQVHHIVTRKTWKHI
jgi:hypothetical protein